MNEENRNLLNEAIKVEFENLSYLGSGSKEKSAAIEDLQKLYKLNIEETKNVMEIDEKVRSRESDERIKRLEIAEKKKERWTKFGEGTGKFLLDLGFCAVWMGLGLMFEETGSLRSPVFRNLWSAFRPKK